jgi:hypothetical protein
MSIINNVLKDLELRSSQFTQIGATSSATESSGPAAVTKPRSSLLIMLSFLLLALVGLVFWFYQISQIDITVGIDGDNSEALINDLPIAEAEVIITPESLPKVDAEEQGNQVIGMQFRESLEAISLEFSLRKKVVSYLKERSEKRIVYHLKNVESGIVAPVISDNRWIEQLTMTAQADGLDINLTTLAGVLVETQQQNLGEEVVWTITLSKRPVPIKNQPVVSVAAIQLVKTDAVIQSDEEIFSVNNNSNAAAKKVVKLEIKSRDAGDDNVQQLKKAQSLIKQRRLNSAETLLLGLLDSTQDLAARELLVIVYRRDKKTVRLNELVAASLKRYPQHAIFKTSHAQSLFQLNTYQRVIDFLMSQTDLNAPQLALIGASFQRLDQHKAAVDFYQQSLQIDAAQSRSWIALGLSEEHNGNLQLALSAYRSASKQGGLSAKLTEFIEKRSRIIEKVIN